MNELTLQMRLNPETIEIICKLCVIFPDSAKVLAWLKAKNLNFGDFSPLYLINTGKAKKVLEFINLKKEGALSSP